MPEPPNPDEDLRESYQRASAEVATLRAQLAELHAVAAITDWRRHPKTRPPKVVELSSRRPPANPVAAWEAIESLSQGYPIDDESMAEIDALWESWEFELDLHRKAILQAKLGGWISALTFDHDAHVRVRKAAGAVADAYVKADDARLAGCIQELGRVLERDLEYEREVERVIAAPDEQIEAELREAGFDISHVPTAEKLLERAAERSKQRAAVANVVPRRHVEATVRVSASPHAVMRALCDVAAICVWSGASRALVQPYVGGAWALAWDPQAADSRQVSAGQVDAFEEARRLVVTGIVCVRADRPPLGPTSLTFQIAVDGDGSYLRMEEVGFGEGPQWDEFYATEREDWPLFAQRIRDVAEGAVP